MPDSPDMLARLAEHKLVPVVAIHEAAHADPLAEALIAAGLPVAEITFRTDAAEASIAAMARRGDVLVGAGTVLTVEQAKRAVDAGAGFIVAPGTGPAVVEWCVANQTPIFPGVATPTDITLALSFGLEVLKFFPAEAYGGASTLKALSAPFKQVRFIPTGGINTENLSQYLALPSVVACGGSWMVKADWMKDGRWDEITRVTDQAVSLAKSAG